MNVKVKGKKKRGKSRWSDGHVALFHWFASGIRGWLGRFFMGHHSRIPEKGDDRDWLGHFLAVRRSENYRKKTRRAVDWSENPTQQAPFTTIALFDKWQKCPHAFSILLNCISLCLWVRTVVSFLNGNFLFLNRVVNLWSVHEAQNNSKVIAKNKNNSKG